MYKEPLTIELYSLLPEYLIKVEECLHCGLLYKECDNMGRQLCRIHPGIRLLTNDRIPNRAFYSCCGHHMEAKGCLQVDHSRLSFSETDIQLRITQIRNFATVIVPHLLLRFVTPPLPSAILCDTKKPKCETLFRYQFTPLREVLLRTNELRLAHPLDVNHWALCEDYGGGSGAEQDDEEITVKTYDVAEEGRSLFLTGKESPLFSQLMHLGATQTESALLKACDNAWRNHLGEEKLQAKRRGLDEKVSFMIISRINSRLDVF